MRKLIYSMGVSLDGYVAGPGGDIGWSAPSEELHRFHNEQMREVGVHLCGRRLYETMLYWETAEEDGGATGAMLEFARIWREVPRIVFSSTLESVLGNATLVRGDPVTEVARLKAQPGKDIAVGGPGLASSLIRQKLIDEYRLFVSPVVLGGGTSYFPTMDESLGLELLETRVFACAVVYLRYRSRSGAT